MADSRRVDFNYVRDQTMHVVEHGRYCKTSDEWRQIYDQKALSNQVSEFED
ncbi:MAG: hypothetical protein VYE46_04545 [Cyanobacteriota bacterium]|nr:hypothetical protein [Cyanobacteriota bacterium]